MNREKEKRAIDYLRTFEPESESYYLCYSGGKDSDCIRILAELAGVNHEVHHNLTTVDVPETVQYIRAIMSEYGERQLIKTETERFYRYGDKGFIHLPELTMWELIVKKKMPPTRLARYCCEALKERGGKGRIKITGVRWAESRNRKENQGQVTIIGKSKTVQKMAVKNSVNFRLTDRGGGIK